MLTRVYIDNFRCFVNFEWKPGRKQLILGPNGSGKSTLMEALLRLRQFIAGRQRVDELYRLQQRTRWLSQPQQTCEIEANLNGVDFVYRLTIKPDPSADVPLFHVASETLCSCGKPLLEFIDGEVRLYSTESRGPITYPAVADRSVLANVPAKGNEKLGAFRDWILKLYYFRVNPFEMLPEAREEAPFAEVSLRNFSAWHRRLRESFPTENTAFLDDMRSAIDGFSDLIHEYVAENTTLLVAEFAGVDGGRAKFAFNELSEGQRCLIALYATLHFCITRGGTVIIDEPDNFIALREIQPWLTAVTDAVDDGEGQVLLISHHPEVLNQWAPDFGVQFIREGVGPVRVRAFQGPAESSLTPAELIARGWEIE
jgi:predicted ATPase